MRSVNFVRFVSKRNSYSYAFPMMCPCVSYFFFLVTCYWCWCRAVIKTYGEVHRWDSMGVAPTSWFKTHSTSLSSLFVVFCLLISSLVDVIHILRGYLLQGYLLTLEQSHDLLGSGRVTLNAGNNTRMHMKDRDAITKTTRKRDAK